MKTQTLSAGTSTALTPSLYDYDTYSYIYGSPSYVSINVTKVSLSAIDSSFGTGHRGQRRGQGDVDGADDGRLLLRGHQLRLLRPRHFVRRVVGTFRWHLAERDDHEHQPHDQWAA